MVERTREHDRFRTHAVVFDDPERTLDAVRALRTAGFTIEDVHTPFAVHGMEEAMGLPETRLPWATFVGGVAGGCLALFFQIWTHTTDWPLNIGGKSDMALPALVPVSFELTILLSAFATVGALLWLGKLFPRPSAKHPKTQPHVGVTDDRFVVVVLEEDASVSFEDLKLACATLGSEEIVESWRLA